MCCLPPASSFDFHFEENTISRQVSWPFRYFPIWDLAHNLNSLSYMHSLWFALSFSALKCFRIVFDMFCPCLAARHRWREFTPCFPVRLRGRKPMLLVSRRMDAYDRPKITGDSWSVYPIFCIHPIN